MKLMMVVIFLSLFPIAVCCSKSVLKPTPQEIATILDNIFLDVLTNDKLEFERTFYGYENGKKATVQKNEVLVSVCPNYSPSLSFVQIGDGRLKNSPVSPDSSTLGIELGEWKVEEDGIAVTVFIFSMPGNVKGASDIHYMIVKLKDRWKIRYSNSASS